MTCSPFIVARQRTASYVPTDAVAPVQDFISFVERHFNPDLLGLSIPSVLCCVEFGAMIRYGKATAFSGGFKGNDIIHFFLHCPNQHTSSNNLPEILIRDDMASAALLPLLGNRRRRMYQPTQWIRFEIYFFCWVPL
ncbi:hypothetical protein CEXT_155311 [Caerostris extrusa]|uniref:Uncharacterized protein n=1 Tax=Caerostris extrusa TaxID=172846 RepID=A0AAV4SHS6_CAEEX|nr:hypothetical protein CEXT_155311 [Caerostris extrusa]